MAQYSQNEPDYYGDSPAEEQKPGESQESPEQEDKEQEGQEPTAVLPKSILMGKDFKPGEEVVLKIVRIHDDQVEVAYAPEKGKEGEGEGEMAEAPAPGPEAGGGDQEMAGMMS